MAPIRNFVALFLISNLALSLSQCTHSSEGSQRASPTNETVSLFIPRACSFPQGPNTVCGTVAVPQQRQEIGGKQLDIDIAVFKAHIREPSLPVVLLCGGPGAHCVGKQWETNPLRKQHDLVVIELRGVAKSAPITLCPELPSKIIDTIIDDLSPSQELSRRVADYETCVESLERRNVDLSAFSSKDAAADVRDVVKGLGYRTWALWGLSYGSRVAQEILRNPTDGLRAVVLDGPVPIDQEHVAHQMSWFVDSLNQMFRACAAQQRCNSAYPNLESNFYSALADYSEHPLQVQLPPGVQGAATVATVNAQDLIAFMRRAMYSDRNYPMLPFYVHAIWARQKDLIGPVFGHALRDLANRSFGLRVVMTSVDNSLFQTKAALLSDLERHPRLISADSLTSADVSFYKLWRSKGRPTTGPAGFQPVKSSIPTLLITGAWDPITPPSNIEHLRHNFSAVQAITVPYAGHGMIGHPCGVRIGQTFLANPQKSIRVPCIELEKPPRFHVSP